MTDLADRPLAALNSPPAWRQAVLPLAYAAALIAVLLPLSQLFSPERNNTEIATARPADAPRLARQIGQVLARGAACVQGLRPGLDDGALMHCLSAGYGAAQIFVVSTTATGVLARPLGGGRDQQLGATTHDWLARATSNRTSVVYGAAPLIGSVSGAMGIDQFIPQPGAGTSAGVLVRYRWNGLRTQVDLPDGFDDRLLDFQVRRPPEASAAASNAKDGLAVAIPDAADLMLVLKGEPAAPARSAIGGAGALERPAAILWPSLAATALLLTAGVALFQDRRWRAKERAISSALNARLRENENLNRQLVMINQELIDVVYASEQVHTWKNLIGPVVNTLTRCQRWLAAPPLEAELPKCLDLVANGLDTANRLALELKEFALQPGEPVAVEVVSLVARSLSMSQTKAREAQTKLINAVNEGLPKVLVEDGLVSMALSGLIDNGIRAMSDGEIHSGNRTLVVSARQLKDRPFVRLTIRDQGGGIPAQQLQGISEGAWGISGTPGGHGSGVARCRMILHRSKGELGEIRNSDEGASIDVLLPIAPDQAGART